MLLVAGLLVAASCLAIPRVRFTADLRSLVGTQSEAARDFFALQDRGAANEALFATVTGGAETDLDRRLEFAEDLRDRLLERTGITSVTSGPTRLQTTAVEEFVLPRMFLLMEPAVLEAALERLRPEALDRSMREARALLESAAPLTAKELLLADPFGLREVEGLLPADPGVARERGLLVSREDGSILLRITGEAAPTDRRAASRFLATVRETIRDASSGTEGLTVDLAGGHIYAEQDEAMIRGDLVKTALPSLVAVVLLFWIFYRSLGALLVAVVPVVFAFALTLGAVGLLGLRLTPVAAAFCALLVGLGVDFGIHLLSAFDVERKAGASPAEAVLRARAGVGRGIILGGLTTSIAFGILALADLPGLASLGAVLGVGILLSTAGALVLGPALLRVLPHGRTGLGGDAFAALATRLSRHRRTLRGVTVVVVAFTVVTLATMGTPPLRTDPREFRPDDDPATRAILRLKDRFAHLTPTDLVTWRGTDLDVGLREVARAGRALESRGLITAWDGPDRLVPDRARQERNLAVLRTFDAAEFAESTRDAMRRHGLRVEPFEPAIERVTQALSRREPVPATALESPGLAPVTERWVVPAGDQRLLVAYLAPTPGPGTRERIGAVLADATPTVRMAGPRAILDELESRVSDEFTLLSGLALFAVVAVTWIGFRRATATLAAATPMIVGALLALAVMRWLDVPFNLVNVAVVPMILGLGVDDGIQVVNRHRRTPGGDIVETYRHTGGAVLLTTLTTGVAFGSLALAESPGLASMGILVVCGTAACCAVTLLLMPGWLGDRARSTEPS